MPVLIDIGLQRETHLAQVISARGGECLSLSPGKRRQEHRRQNRDNGQNHQEFNQGESVGMSVESSLASIGTHIGSDNRAPKMSHVLAGNQCPEDDSAEIGASAGPDSGPCRNAAAV